MRVRLIAVAAVLALVACGCARAQPEEGTSDPAAASTVEAIYGVAAQSLREAGVYHLTADVTRTRGADTGRGTLEQWFDVAHDESRTAWTSTSGTTIQASLQLIAGQVDWEDGSPGTAAGCHGSRAAAAAVLGCPFATEQVTSTVVRGTYQGVDDPVLLTSSVVVGDSATIKETSRTYLDQHTGLPLRQTIDGTAQSNATVTPLHEVRTYHGATLAGGVKAGFFDPASLGWRAPDPLLGMPLDKPVYWLGTTWSPGGGLPALSLQSVSGPGGPGYFAILHYAAAAAPYGAEVLMIQESTSAASRPNMAIPPCKGNAHLTLPDGTADFYCPTGGDGIAVLVDLPQAHLLVGVIGATVAGLGVRPNPYDNVRALTVLIQQLALRS